MIFIGVIALVTLIASTLYVYVCRRRWERLMKRPVANPIPKSVTDTKRVIVIGSGVSGLSTAKTFLQYGYRNVVILESSNEIGGVWRSDQYSGASIQTPYWLYEFPDFPWPRDLILNSHCPDQAVVQEYCRRYASQFGIQQKVRFGHKAVSAKRENEVWQVKTEKHGIIEADILIMAVGNNDKSNPIVPNIPNRSSFQGTVLHSSQVGDGKILETAEHIAVIGGSHSAFDIGLMQPRKTTAVIRTPHFWIPQWALHVPFFDRIAFYIFRGYRVKKSDRSYLIRFLDEVCLFMLSLGLDRTPGNHSVLDDCTRGGSLHVITPLDKYRAAKFNWKLEYATPVSYSQQGIRLSNGGHVRADVIVWGTGFQPSKFLGKFFEGIELQDSLDDGLYLYKYIVHPMLPDCYFCGFRDPAANVPFLSNVQAVWAVFGAAGLLPHQEKSDTALFMSRLLKYRMDHTRTKFPASHRRAFYDWLLDVPHNCNYTYAKELLRDCGSSRLATWWCQPCDIWSTTSEFKAEIGAKVLQPQN